MILNLKKGSQILGGKKIADLDAGEPTQAASLQQASQPAALQPAPAPATSAPAAEPEVPQPSEDWRDLLVRLLVSAPEEVSAQLINCLSSDVLLKALEKKNDPYLKVALMLLTKK
mgnify:CR=1 FL=1|jgi:pyruvate/2-oxoglutarate dehydrogenase complex dihydrolipoamide acyltransferase (E2) component